MAVNLSHVVEIGRKHMEEAQDSKAWADHYEMEALITAGASMASEGLTSGGYLIQVLYQGVWFVHTCGKQERCIKIALPS